MTRVRKFPIGGAHLPEEKALAAEKPIEAMPVRGPVTIPLRQHLGLPALPCVRVGDRVRRGERVGEPAPGLSTSIHSGVSGCVTALATCRLADGAEVPAVTIEPDGDGMDADITLPPLALDGLSDAAYAEAVCHRVAEAGIVGLGGAGFPTHLKLASRADIDTVIVNGAECEPYITVDDRLMREQAEMLFRGLEIVRRTVGASQGLVACEINKPDALEELQSAAAAHPALDAVPLDTRYPHGAEKHLVKAVLNREVPLRALPGAVGVLVNNVQTVLAIAEAVEAGRVLHSRVVTVSGRGVRNPRNLRIPLGTPVGEAIAQCGGAVIDDPAIIVGGPMTGIRITDLEIPIIKMTSGIILLTETEYAQGRPSACIRCGKCVEVCPMYLPPNRITAHVLADQIDAAVESGLDACILCGACQYVCPAKRPLVTWLRQGKAAVVAGRGGT